VGLIFYDTETTGTNPAFDQILQFAAIRTDDDLNETGRFEARSRLLPYVIPSPGALRVTGLTIDDLLDESHPSHYEMVCRVRETLAGWCPSAFLAYNGLRFDEEFLRQAFYQCLHPPYLTNTGGSKRADALALVQTAALLHPNALAVPLSEKGRPVFKLDRLAPVNGFDHSNAHDALADVEATIFLCKLVKDRCPEVWRRFLRFATKDAVADFIYGVDAFVLVQPSRQTAYAVTALGDHPAMNNISYCWDLRVDPRQFADLSDEELPKALAKSGSPVRKLKKNAAPSLCPLDEAPDHIVPADERELLERRGRWVRRDREFVLRVLRASADNETEYPPSPHVERQIYDGFWSAADGRRLQAFHAGDWGARVRIADELEDRRLAWLARRIIWVERPDLCPEPQATALAEEKARRLLAAEGESGGWNTLEKASAELTNILDGLGADAASPFLKLAEYLSHRRAHCEGLLGLVPA
jgi:exodeoxyribonuclease-1